MFMSLKKYYGRVSINYTVVGRHLETTKNNGNYNMGNYWQPFYLSLKTCRKCPSSKIPWYVVSDWNKLNNTKWEDISF